MFRHIWKKEIQGELYTWKSMLWLLIASLLFSVTSYLLLTNKELSLLDQTELLWLLGKIIIGVALLIVTVDASSIITGEFEKETAESLFVSPLRLKDFVIGKLLASLTLWAAIFIVSIPYILVTSAGSNLAVAFLAYVALLGTLGILGLVFLIFAVSLLFRSSKNTLTTSLILLLGLSIPAVFTSTLKTDVVSQAISKVNPIDTIFSSLDNVLVDYQLSLAQNWQYILPLVIFCALTFGILIFSMRHFEKKGIISYE
jgi:ABC-type transport system involved in multi-copper enzyme maturation permease subunit